MRNSGSIGMLLTILKEKVQIASHSTGLEWVLGV